MTAKGLVHTNMLFAELYAKQELYTTGRQCPPKSFIKAKQQEQVKNQYKTSKLFQRNKTLNTGGKNYEDGNCTIYSQSSRDRTKYV